MSPITISLIVFVCVSGGAFVGMILRVMLPERHLSKETEDVIKLGLGLITTMTALVLGLLISTAKAAYDLKRTQLGQIAADAILVDRSLALYGSETKEARSALRDLVVGLVDQIQSIRRGLSEREPSGVKAETADFYQMVRRLAPRDDTQKSIKAEALTVSFEVGQIRALALAQQSSSIPLPFLVVLVFWLTILFAGLGLFCPAKLNGGGRTVHLRIIRFGSSLYDSRDGRTPRWIYTSLYRAPAQCDNCHRQVTPCGITSGAALGGLGLGGKHLFRVVTCRLPERAR